MEEVLEDLQGSKFFTTMDLYSGYWQVPMDKYCKQMTTFTRKEGVFRFEVMPFGLKNAQATFQRMINEVLGDIPNVRVYIDDAVVYSSSLEDHIQTLEMDENRIKSAGLKIKPDKCFFVQRKLHLFGHIIDENGILIDPETLSRVKKALIPAFKTEVCSFLVLTSYYRLFIKNFAMIAQPLHAATTPKGRFTWNDEMELSFESLKQRLTTAPVLAYPDFPESFVVETDASDFVVGAILSERDGNGRMHPIQFASRTMNQS